MKKLIIFGFDGTLADTSPGILYCLNTTASSMGYNPVEMSSLLEILGTPLEEIFRTLFNMTEDEAEYAAKNYSKLYSQKGSSMFVLYDNILDTLKRLRADGCKLAIATQKHEMYTRDMLEALGAIELFDAVCATDVDKNLTKSDLLLQACEETGIAVEDSIMIGDTAVDSEGAAKIGMDFAAALYGLGFREEADAKAHGCKVSIKTVADLYNALASV